MQSEVCPCGSHGKSQRRLPWEGAADVRMRRKGVLNGTIRGLTCGRAQHHLFLDLPWMSQIGDSEEESVTELPRRRVSLGHTYIWTIMSFRFQTTSGSDSRLQINPFHLLTSRI